MTPAAPGNKSPCDEQLILDCEDHLEREEILLTQTVESLGAVRTAISSADWEKLRDLLSFQVRLEADTSRIAYERDSLRGRIASISGIPGSAVTLRSIVAVGSSGRGQPSFDRHERLVRMVADAELLRRTIVTLVRFSIDFHQKMLEGLTGRSSHQRYSAVGTWQDVVFGSMIQQRG